MALATDAKRTPTLWVDPHAWAKIMMYAELCPLEVNGFAYLKVITPNDLLLASSADVFITDQVVTPGSADVHGSTVAFAVDQAVRAGRGSELHLQWHSHVNMDAYCSDTDMATIDAYGKAGVQWMVSVVVNKRGKYVARLDVFAPLRVGVEVQVRQYVNAPDIRATCLEDLVAHVQQPAVPGRLARRWANGKTDGKTVGLFDDSPRGAAQPTVNGK